MRRKTKLARWDASVHDDCKRRYPSMSSAEISRMLYDHSLIKAEVVVARWDKRMSKNVKKQKR